MTQSEPYLKYYKYLSKTFGRVDCIGCLQLAHVLSVFNLGDRLFDVYNRYANEINSTPFAVERNLRTYVNVISKDLTIEDMSRILDYEFKPYQNKVTLGEFIPVLKMFVDSLDEDQ